MYENGRFGRPALLFWQVLSESYAAKCFEQVTLEAFPAVPCLIEMPHILS